MNPIRASPRVTVRGVLKEPLGAASEKGSSINKPWGAVSGK